MATDTDTGRRLLEHGVSALERTGYRIERPASGALPDAVGVRAAERTDGRVAVEPLPADEVDPTIVLSRLSNGASNGRLTLFVVEDEESADACTRILRSPPFVRDEDEFGRRAFYDGPGRVELDDGRYAAYRGDDPNLRWREEGIGDEKRLVLRDESRGGGEGDGNGGSSTGGGDVIAVLPSVDALCRADAGAFRYSYAREEDKRIRVRARGGREVGAYSGFAAMRHDAYVPVPMPLVPEHVFDGAGSARREWAVLVAGTGSSGRAFGPGADGTF